MPRPLRVMLAGSGTGGHVFPAVALAEEVLRRHPESAVLFVGTARGLEARVLPGLGYALEPLTVGGLKRQGLWRQLRTLTQLPPAVHRSRAIVRRFRPDVVVGIGGYASGPLLLAAAACRVPTALVEPNSIPGLTNRVLARLAKRVFVAFKQAEAHFPKGKTLCLGNPIRRNLRLALGEASAGEAGEASAGEASAGEAAVSVTPTLFVCGGSQGAHALNLLVLGAVERLRADGRALRLLHQTGEADLTMVGERYQALGIEADVRPFIDDMAAAYRQAELVVSRAGATSIAELTVAARPALLIPFPFAADDHQTHNASALAEAGAARLLPQEGLSPEKLAGEIGRLLGDPEQRRAMGQAMRRLARPDAAERIVDRLEELADATAAAATPREAV